MLLYKALDRILHSIVSEPFILTVSGRTTAPLSDALQTILALPEIPKKIVLKTLTLQNKPVLQLNVYTKKQHFTKNISLLEREPVMRSIMEAVLQEPFIQAHLQTPQEDLYLRAMLKKSIPGSYSTKRTDPSRIHWEEESHDEKRNYMITIENSLPLLRALGICNEQGNLIPSMQAKYRQMNHFLAIASSMELLSSSSSSDPVRIVDCGCGKAYLSLALYHWLHTLQGRRVELTGIDTNPQLIDFCRRTAQQLGYEHLHFLCAPISSYHADSLDLVIALHACDTATDDALALALRSHAKAILAAPCCHHFVNAKLRASTAPEQVALLLQDGITRERFADLLTDSMRRDILAAYGYSASLIEFVAPEHTTKNIMIRAEKKDTDEPDIQKLSIVVQQIQLWHTGPRLAELVQLI